MGRIKHHSASDAWPGVSQPWPGDAPAAPAWPEHLPSSSPQAAFSQAHLECLGDDRLQGHHAVGDVDHLQLGQDVATLLHHLQAQRAGAATWVSGAKRKTHNHGQCITCPDAAAYSRRSAVPYLASQQQGSMGEAAAAQHARTLVMRRRKMARSEMICARWSLLRHG